MLKIKEKLQEERGTALMLAIAILSILTLMSACFALALPTAYKNDDVARRVEQGSIYAKAGLNMAVNEITKRAKESGKPIAYLKALRDGSGKITGKLSNLNYTSTVSDAPTALNNDRGFPGFEITFQALDDGSLRVVSSVNYQGVVSTAYRNIYYSSSGSAVSPFKEDAIACADRVDILSSINGRIRARTVNLAGKGTYRSVYALETLETNDSWTAFIKDNSGVVGTEGNLYSSKNLRPHNLYMADSRTFTGSSNPWVNPSVSDDPKYPGGILAAGGYILSGVKGLNGDHTINWGSGGVAHPQAIIAHGKETINVKTDWGTKDYALCNPGTKMEYIGSSVMNEVSNEESLPLAVYSNGSAYASGNACTIYGSVLIKGDLDFGNYGTMTVYGNVYLTGNVHKKNSWGTQLVIKSIKEIDSSYSDVGGTLIENMSDADFAAICGKYTYLSYTDIVNEVGDRNLLCPKLPTLSKTPIQDFFGVTDGSNVYALDSSGVNVMNPPYAQSCVLIHVTQSTEITGDLAQITGNSFQKNTYTEWDGTEKVSLVCENNKNVITTDPIAGTPSGLAELKTSSGSTIDTSGIYMRYPRAALFLDAKAAVDSGAISAGQNLDVIISGEWIFGAGNAGDQWRQGIYINDNDGQNAVRIFIRKGTGTKPSEFIVTAPQIYVPNSERGNITATNIFNGSLSAGTSIPTAPGSTVTGLNYEKIPRFFVFAEGETEDVTVGGVVEKKIKESTQPLIAIAGETGTIRGFVLTPLAEVDLAQSGEYTTPLAGGVSIKHVLGKISAGYFNNPVANTGVLDYVRPWSSDIYPELGLDPNVDYEALATVDVFPDATGGGGGGTPGGGGGSTETFSLY